jgi:acetolactate synthase-1/2/3 large subunit
VLDNGAYHDVARALGVDGYYAEDAAGLEAALRSALAKDVPACINVCVDLDPVPPEEQILMGQNPF